MAAVGAGRSRKWGCHRASCPRSGGRGVGHRGGRGGGWGPRVAKGSRLLRARGGARLRGGGGPTGAAAPRPHKERRPGPRLYGPDGPWWPRRDPGRVARGKRHFLPGPPPRAAPRRLRSRRPEGSGSPPTSSSAPATVLTCALKRSALPAALRFSAGSKPLGLQVFRFSQALAPPLPGWTSASITRRGPALPSGGSPGWPTAPFISRLRPSPWHSAPSVAPRPSPGSTPPPPAPQHSAAHPAPKPQMMGGFIAARPASNSTLCILTANQGG